MTVVFWPQLDRLPLPPKLSLKAFDLVVGWTVEPLNRTKCQKCQMNYPIRSEWHNPVTFGRRGRCLKVSDTLCCACSAVEPCRLWGCSWIPPGSAIDPSTRSRVDRSSARLSIENQNWSDLPRIFSCSAVAILCIFWWTRFVQTFGSSSKEPTIQDSLKCPCFALQHVACTHETWFQTNPYAYDSSAWQGTA